MTDATAHPVIRRYLDELETALRDLPKERRHEIVRDIEEHIEAATAGSSNEADLRNALEQVGDPEAIAAEARERFGISHQRGGALEAAAIVLLLIGGLVVPGLGWLVGVVLLWISSVWSVRDKTIGTLVLPGGLALPVYLFLFAPVGTTVCTTPAESTRRGRLIEEVGICHQEPLTSEWWGLLLMALVVLLPIVTTIYLGRRAFRR